MIFKLSYLIELLLNPDDYLEPCDTSVDMGDANLCDDEERVGNSNLKLKIILFMNWIYINNELTQKEVFIREQLGFIKLFEKELNRL